MELPIVPPAETGLDYHYAVILINHAIDRFGHNEVFAAELHAAFLKIGLHVRILDYHEQAGPLAVALRDPQCLFFLCFNGFGAELVVPTQTPGALVSAFMLHRKPLFDLMHDCPAWEAMVHQVESRGPWRRVLFTDYGYAQLGRLMGFADARFAPSITFPDVMPHSGPPLERRPIEVLVPVGLSSPADVQRRHANPVGYRGRIFREIFQEVGERAAGNLELDPLTETFLACSQAGVALDPASADGRFLLSTIADFVKFERRRRLLKALVRLPVTIVSDRPVESEYPDARFTYAPARSFQDLLRTMADSRVVVCPLPHMSGFHERAMGAFSAGALVLCSPNILLETEVPHGRGMLVYRNPEAAAAMLGDILRDPRQFQAVADYGRQEVMARFAPRRLAEIVVSLHRLGPWGQ